MHACRMMMKLFVLCLLISTAFGVHECNSNTTSDLHGHNSSSATCEDTCNSIHENCTVAHHLETECGNRNNQHHCELPDRFDQYACKWYDRNTIPSTNGNGYCTDIENYCSQAFAYNVPVSNSSDMCQGVGSTEEVECGTCFVGFTTDTVGVHTIIGGVQVCKQSNTSADQSSCERNVTTTYLPDGNTTDDQPDNTCIDCSGQVEFECLNQLNCEWVDGNQCRKKQTAIPECHHDDDKDHLPLILGLSIGLGVPFVAGIIYCAVRGRRIPVLDDVREAFIHG